MLPYVLVARRYPLVTTAKRQTIGMLMRATSRIPQRTGSLLEISQLQHNDNVVNISVEEIVQVSQVQVMTKTNRDPTVTARVSLMVNSDKTM